MNIEDKKLLAKWMEYEYIGSLHVKDKNGEYVADGNEWLKSSRDLTEVLAKLDEDQKTELYNRLPVSVDGSNEYYCDEESVMDFAMWLQNDNNAETILRAVAEVIKA